MDKNLLNAFSNLSLALEELSRSLDESRKSKETSQSSIKDTLKSLDIGNQIKSINEGIKEIQKDNKEILKNQKNSASAISNQKTNKPGEDQFSKTINPTQQKNIKDGVKIILLIAGGVLALGLAFKIIGSVDIKSVIALSIAMPLMAMSFEKISKVKIVLKDLLIANIGLIMMATTIAISSRILQGVVPVGITQIFTTIFIAGAFAILSISLHKLSEGIKGVDPKNLWKMPLVLVAASVAITASSYILQGIKPVGFLQLTTAILIAAAFSVISFGLGKLVSGINGIKNPEFIDEMPLVLIAVSAAILGSSYLLSNIKPIRFDQALTAIAISATFVVLSYGLPKIADAVEKVSPEKALMMPLILTALSAAIWASSLILSNVKVIQYTTLLNIAAQSIVLTLIGVVFGSMIFLFDKMGVTVDKAIRGGLSLIIISAAISASSLLISSGNYTNAPSILWTLNTGVSLLVFGVLAFFAGPETESIVSGSFALLLVANTIALASVVLSLGTYDKFPNIAWSLGVGSSMLAFGIAMTVLGAEVDTGVGAAVLLSGAVAILGVAATILGTSDILNNGNYDKYPNLPWVVGVGLSLMEFSAVMVASGLLIIPIGLGSLVMPLIANSIVETSNILSNGIFTGGPSLNWAAGTGLLITTFGYSMMIIGSFIGSTLGVGYLALMAGGSAIKLISQSIVDAGGILSGGKFTGGPSEEWAKGVGGAISAFSSVYEAILSQSILSKIFSGGADKQMRNAILTISDGILTAAIKFSGLKSGWDDGPNESWAKGVGGAISAFAPVYKALGFWSTVSPDDMANAIQVISQGIVDAGRFFNDNSVVFTGSYPSEEWGTGVGAAISAFTPVLEHLKGSGISGWFTGESADDMKDSIIKISESLRDSSISLSNGDYKNSIPEDYIKNLTTNIKEYMKLISYINDVGNNDTSILGITISSSGISKIADDYEKLASSVTKLSSSIQSLDIEKLTALKTFTGSIVLMSLMDPEQFEAMMDKLEEKAKIFVDVVNDIEKGGETTVSVKTSSNKSENVTMQDLLTVMNRMDTKLGSISSSNDNISRYVNEIRTPKIGIKKR